MNVLLIANYLPDGQQSMQRYAELLRCGLLQAGHEVRVARPAVIAGRLPVFSKWLGYLDKLVIFPQKLPGTAVWADIVHICDHSNAHYVKQLESKPLLITCHDLFAIRSALGEIQGQKTRQTGRILQSMIGRGLMRARSIVCVSDATKRDLMRIRGDTGASISTIPNALNYPYSPMNAAESKQILSSLGLGNNQRFILHVGGNQWYKNRAGVVRTFSLLKKRSELDDVRLVLAGKPWTTELRELVRDRNLSGSVLELTNVPNETLRALYSRAELLFFPSLQEGFGWPIIEAQACGCPVVTTKAPPMTQVGGEAAIYIDPENEHLASQVIAESIAVRPALVEKSLRNADRFRPEVMIDQYIATYSRILAEARKIAPASAAPQTL